MNKELIPYYEYFDCFFDSFCKITSSMLLSGDNSSDDDSNPEILNIKSIILMLEPLQNDESFKNNPEEPKNSTELNYKIRNKYINIITI